MIDGPILRASGNCAMIPLLCSFTCQNSIVFRCTLPEPGKPYQLNNPTLQYVSRCSGFTKLTAQALGSINNAGHLSLETDVT